MLLLKSIGKVNFAQYGTFKMAKKEESMESKAMYCNDGE